MNEEADHENKKALLYARVSTEEQAKNDKSVHDQITYLIENGNDLGWDIQGFCYDNGYTAGETERPALIHILRLVQQADIDLVAFYHNDRLTRSKDDFYGEIKDIFAETNTDIWFNNLPNVDLDTPEGDMILGNMINMSEYVRKDTKRKTEFALEKKQKDGEWIGKAPLGYDIGEETDHELQINEKEAMAVRQIFKWYTEDEDTSMRDIMDRMNNHPVFGEMKKWSWDVRNIIANPVYTGIIVQKGEKILQGNHSPIISTELFVKAKKKRSKKSRWSKKQKKREEEEEEDE